MSRVEGSRAIAPSTLDLARLDQRLEPGARERDAPRGRRLAEETVEPLARARGVDVENLQPRRRG